MGITQRAQVFSTSIESVISSLRNQEDSDTVESLTVNGHRISQSDFANLMQNPHVPLEEGFESFSPSKFEIYLRVAGREENYFTIDNVFTIDARNHSSFTNTSSMYWLLDSEERMSARVVGASASLQVLEDCPTLSFPVRFDTDSPYTVWVNLVPSIGDPHISYNVEIDGVVIHSEDTATMDVSPQWSSFSLVVPDRETHVLVIRPKRHGMRFIKLCIDRTGSDPSVSDPSFSLSPFVTVHCRLCPVVSGEPDMANMIVSYDAITTLDEIKKDGWSPFDLEEKEGSHSFLGEYAIVVSAIGGSATHYTTWETSPSVGEFHSSSYDGSWTADSNTNYSIRVYSTTDNFDSSPVRSNLAEACSLVVHEFDSTNAEFHKTTLAQETLPNGKVTLDLPKTTTTLVIDQSGSMTWNDRENTRHDLASRLSQRISATSTNDTKYNLISFEGKPSRLWVYATTKDLSGKTAKEIVSTQWENSAAGISGVRLVRKEGSFPDTAHDGDFWDGVFEAFEDSGLTEGKTYYYKVFTYDKDYRFSAGVGISAVPAVRNHPYGVSQFVSKTIKGSGVKIDTGVICAWHFFEGEKSRIHDFSANKIDLVVSGDNWLNRLDVPAGHSGMRFNGSSPAESATSLSGAWEGDQITILSWVYINSLGNTPSGTIIERTSGTDVNYRLTSNASGTLRFEYDANAQYYAEWTNLLPTDEWTHLAVTMDLSSNSFIATVNGNPTVATSSSIGARADYSATPMSVSCGSFLGKITEVSIHSVVRDFSYTSILSAQGNLETQDNGDRLVLFEWFQPQQDANTVTLVAKRGSIPSHVGDGEVVYVGDAGIRDETASDARSFVLGGLYGYRIFTGKNSGEYSTFADSPSIPVVIPWVLPDSVIETPPLSLSPVSSFSADGKNQKVLLEWSFPVDPEIKAVRVYYSKTGYPVVSETTSVGDVVCTLDITETSYVHRIGENDITAYYSIVTIDGYGRISEAVFAQTDITLDQDDTGIHLPEVEDINTEPVNATSLIIRWKIPAYTDTDYLGYLNEPVHIYGIVLDEFGESIESYRSPVLSIVPSVVRNLELDIFEDSSSFALSDYTNWTVTYDNGIAHGLFSVNGLEGNSSAVDSILVSVDFDNEKLNLELKHPLSMRIENLRADSVSYKCRGPSGSAQIYTYDGCYATRTLPLSFRVTMLWKNTEIDAINLRASVRDLTEGSLCGQTIVASSVGNTSLSLLNAESFNLSQSFADVQISIPSRGAESLASFRMGYSGMVCHKNLLLWFPSPLEVEISPSIPLNNGRDRAEQFVNVRIINPDNPADITPPPDGTLVRWNLEAPNFNLATSQPFYSTDTTSRSGGIFSSLVGGTARKVFMGPWSSIPSTGVAFSLSARVVVGTIIGSDKVTFEVGSKNTLDQPVGVFFLSEFPDIENSIYADGEDYIKLRIVHSPMLDPLITGSKYSTCFLETCSNLSNPAITLPPGLIVTVKTADNYEIISGNVVETIDEETGAFILDTEGATVALGNTNIRLNDSGVPFTDLYFRINRSLISRDFVLFKPSIGVCGSLTYQTGSPSGVSLSANMIVSGVMQPLWSGSSQGVPPLIISPKEPLSVRVVDIRSSDTNVPDDGQGTYWSPTDSIIVDGKTFNLIKLEVSFSGYPVPDNTPITLTVSGNGITLYQTTVYTKKDDLMEPDRFVNSLGVPHSYSSIYLPPLDPNVDISAVITATCTFDKSGEIERNSKSLVNILYVSNSPPVLLSGSSVFGGGLFRYDPLGYSWSVLTEMNFERAGHVLSYSGGYLWAIGGMNGRVITGINERYNIGSGEWAEAIPMPTPRMYPQSVTIGDKIYVIGGIGVNEYSMVVQPTVEVMDVNTGEWDQLADMGLGVAMGNAVVVGEFIYVFGGLSGISANTEVSEYNTSICVYDIESNTWDIIRPPEEISGSFMRISPHGILNDGIIGIVGGGSYDITEDYTDSIMSYSRSGVYFDTNSNIASLGEDFDILPSPRYKACGCRIGEKFYLSGGSTAESPYTTMMEEFDTTNPLYVRSEKTPMPMALHSAAMETDGVYVYVSGGVGSGRGGDFVKLILSGNTGMALNGRQSSAVKVQMKDHNNEDIESLSIRMNARAGSNGVVLSDRLVGDFSSGIGSYILHPRSTDNDGTYRIQVDATVESPVLLGSTSSYGVSNSVTQSSGVDGIGTSNVSVFGSRVRNLDDRGIFASGYQRKYSPFDMNPTIMPQGRSLEIGCYSEVTSFPVIRSILSGGTSEFTDVITEMTKLSEHIPFGSSPLFDAIAEASGECYKVSDGKLIYVFSDGDENNSETSRSEADKILKALNESEYVPVVALDMAVGSIKNNLSSRDGCDSPTLLSFSSSTDGYSRTVHSSDPSHVDTMVGDISGRVRGAFGWGSFEYSIDLHYSVFVSTISLSFSTPTNTRATWKYSLSEDGYIFGEWSKENQASDVPVIESTARKINIIAYLESGLTDNDSSDTGSLQLPFLSSISVNFIRPSEDYLYTEAVTLDGEPDQVVVAFDAGIPENSSIAMGIGSSFSVGWDEYETPSRPSVEQGKIVFPYRFHTSGSDYREPLDTVDGILFLARYGPWCDDSVITVYDSTGNIIPVDDYRMDSGSGAIIFGSKKRDSYFVDIRNSNKIRIGMKITNNSTTESVQVRGTGAIYTIR